MEGQEDIIFQEGTVVSWHHRDPDEQREEEMLEELNRRYLDQEEELLARKQKRFRFFLQIAGLMVALVFLGSLVGQWLQTLAVSPWELLMESRELEKQPHVEELQEAVVQLHTRRGSTSAEAKGTGFNIEAEGLIVTNRHLVEDAVSVRASFQGEGTYRATSWEICQEADLAVIEVEGDNLPYVELAADQPETGEEILVIGNPVQLSRVASEGKVLGYRETEQTSDEAQDLEIPREMVIQAPIHQGSSGSPVFNDAQQVIGVIFAQVVTEEEDTWGAAVTVGALRDFLEDR